MPTYEYECPKCGHRFEKFQGINDPPVKVCPECRGRKVRRLIGSGAGLLFKGSGFHITDYRGKGYREAAKKEAGGGSEKPAGEGKPPAGESAKPAAEGKAKEKPAAKKPASGGGKP